MDYDERGEPERILKLLDSLLREHKSKYLVITQVNPPLLANEGYHYVNTSKEWVRGKGRGSLGSNVRSVSQF